jgi:hypothetical protein
MQMSVSKHGSIDMHCIVLPVKFDGRLSILLLKKKQLFTKKWESKVYDFEK